MPPDPFQLQHAGEIREALIMLEGNSGAFELIRHGSLPWQADQKNVLYAVVRSSDSNRVYLLVQKDDAALPGARQWHEVSAADLRHFWQGSAAAEREADAGGLSR